MESERTETQWATTGMVCPNCGNAGADAGPWLMNDSVPFRVVESLERSWRFTPSTTGARVSLLLDAESDRIRWDLTAGLRVECTQCLEDFPLPANIEVSFI